LHWRGCRRFAGAMARYSVSTRVILVKDDDADCAKRVELDGPIQPQLFVSLRRKPLPSIQQPLRL